LVNFVSETYNNIGFFGSSHNGMFKIKKFKVEMGRATSLSHI
jgi:hypothetical protein